MSEKVLLTGGAGFIGSHTAVELIEAGYDVVIADDLSNSEASVIGRIEKITGVRPEFYEVDVSDKEAVRRIFADAGRNSGDRSVDKDDKVDKGTAHSGGGNCTSDIGAVIHFAGYKAVGESVEKPLTYYRNNLDTTLTLLEVMQEFGVKKFIFSSSATVYSLAEGVPFTEESGPLGCTNPYGWTKFMIEQILKDVAAADPEMSVVLLRYFNPIGAHESGLIGEKPNGIPNNLMPYVTQVAGGIRPHLNVFGDDYPTPDGTGVRDYIHVVDLAKGHVAALDYICRADSSEGKAQSADAALDHICRAENSKGCEVFNLGTGTGYSVLDLVKTFERVNGIDVPYEIAPRRAGDIAECYADPGKAERVLGWKAERGIEEMCRDAWRWQQRSE